MKPTADLWPETGGQPPLRVGQLTPEEIAEWNGFEAEQRPGIDLCSCRDCKRREGLYCGPLRRMHVPVELVHRCKMFSPRWERGR